MPVVCPECRHHVPTEARYCPHCGTALVQGTDPGPTQAPGPTIEDQISSIAGSFGWIVLMGLGVLMLVAIAKGCYQIITGDL